MPRKYVVGADAPVGPKNVTNPPQPFRRHLKPRPCPGEAEQLPERDEHLHGGADDEDELQIRDRRDGEIDAQPRRPDERRDGKPLHQNAPPQRREHDAHDARHRHRVQEKQPRRERHGRDREGREQDRRDHEHQRHRQQHHVDVEMRVGLFGRLLLADEVADGDAVELRDLREDIDVGQALAPLPLGNGLIGVIELAREVQLGILMGFAVSGDIFCYGAPQRLFVLDHKDAPFP